MLLTDYWMEVAIDSRLSPAKFAGDSWRKFAGDSQQKYICGLLTSNK